MPQTFVYRARNLSGHLLAGKIEAEDQKTALARLREKNYFVVKIRPAQGWPTFNLSGLLGLKIKTKELAVFCRQFATMSEAGIPLLPCLNVLKAQTEGKALRQITVEVIGRLEKGTGLSEAFKSHQNQLPEIFINLLAAGEVSGTIDQSLRRLADYFEKEHATKEKIKSAMTYPLLVGGIAILAVIFLMIFIVPIFVDIFTQQGAVLPLPTRIVIGISYLITKYWYLILLVILGMFFSLRKALATVKGKKLVDRLILRLPVVGPLSYKSIVARFARTLSILLKSGVPLVQSLETMEKVAGNSLVAEEIKGVRESIKEGEGMSPLLLKSKVFPPMAVNMMAIGEESGTLDNLLEKVAIFYEQEVENMVAKLSSTIEPLLIAGVGLVVGFIALSIYLPLFSMAGALQKGTGM
jgi:type IV pilus assembly protein PilC